MYRYLNYCGMQMVGCCFRTHKGFMPGAGADAEEVIVQRENNVSLDMSNMVKGSPNFVLVGEWERDHVRQNENTYMVRQNTNFQNSVVKDNITKILNFPKWSEIPKKKLERKEVVIVKNGKRICGSGGALANISIAQNKCYFEIRIQSLGNWSFGVATTNCDLNQLPLGKDDQSWVLCSSGSVMHNSTEVDKVSLNLNEGDCIGCSYDHVEMNFYLNGKNLYCPMRRIKGTVRPVVSVEDGCIIDVNFDSFVFPPPSGFQKLMVEIDLL